MVRLGGDEFCVVRHRSDRAQAEGFVTEIAAAMERVRIGSMTLSTGVGIACRPADGTHPAALLELADERLIASKAARPAHAQRGPALAQTAAPSDRQAA